MYFLIPYADGCACWTNPPPHSQLFFRHRPHFECADGARNLTDCCAEQIHTDLPEPHRKPHRL